jgi:hypothetical protein
MEMGKLLECASTPSTFWSGLACSTASPVPRLSTLRRSYLRMTGVTPKIPILEFERGSPKDVIDKDHHIHENTFLEHINDNIKLFIYIYIYIYIFEY